MDSPRTARFPAKTSEPFSVAPFHPSRCSGGADLSTPPRASETNSLRLSRVCDSHGRGRWGCERSCKPDPVPPRREGATISLGPNSRSASNDLPGSGAGRRLVLPYSIFLQVGFTLPALSPGPRCALTAPFHPCRPHPEGSGVGGLFSVALSLASRPVAVSNHPDPWSPDFPPPGKTPRAAARTSRIAGEDTRSVKSRGAESGAPPRIGRNQAGSPAASQSSSRTRAAQLSLRSRIPRPS